MIQPHNSDFPFTPPFRAEPEREAGADRPPGSESARAGGGGIPFAALLAGTGPGSAAAVAEADPADLPADLTVVFPDEADPDEADGAEVPPMPAGEAHPEPAVSVAGAAVSHGPDFRKGEQDSAGPAPWSAAAGFHVVIAAHAGAGFSAPSENVGPTVEARTAGVATGAAMPAPAVAGTGAETGAAPASGQSAEGMPMSASWPVAWPVARPGAEGDAARPAGLASGAAASGVALQGILPAAAPGLPGGGAGKGLLLPGPSAGSGSAIWPSPAPDPAARARPEDAGSSGAGESTGQAGRAASDSGAPAPANGGNRADTLLPPELPRAGAAGSGTGMPAPSAVAPASGNLLARAPERSEWAGAPGGQAGADPAGSGAEAAGVSAGRQAGGRRPAVAMPVRDGASPPIGEVPGAVGGRAPAGGKGRAATSAPAGGSAEPHAPPETPEMAWAGLTPAADREDAQRADAGPVPAEPRVTFRASAALQAPWQPLFRNDAVPRAVEQVAQAAAALGERPVELTLSPESLGRVRLALQALDGGMAVSVTAERPETLDFLRRHIDLLATQLRELGYDRLSFAFSGEGQSPGNGSAGGNDPPPARTGDAGSGTSDRPGETPETSPTPLRLALDSGRGIDIRL